MAFSGPSKEELENYFRNSRQYFDELAKYYQQSDKQYYDEFIAPFYNNPFRMAGAKSSGSSGKGVIVLAVFLLMLGAALALYFIASEAENNSEETTYKKTEKVSEKIVSSPDTSGIKQADYYEKAMNYYVNRDFDNAEKYFKLVPKKDKNFPDAIKKLKTIEEKKIKEQDNSNERNDRTQAKKRIN